MIAADGISLSTLLAIVAVFFALAVIFGIALVFPEWSGTAVASIRRAIDSTFGKARAVNRSVQNGTGTLRDRSNIVTRHWLGIAKHNGLLLGITGLAMATPVIFALAFQRHAGIDQFDDVTLPSDPVILALLQGEQLMPPAPLPPEVFTTREIEMIRPALGTASRDWSLLDAEFRQRLLVVFEIMRQRGYELALIEGYRSPDRQDYLASLGSHITSAGAFQSYHQVGLAADCAFFLGGRIVIDERDPWAMRGYKLLGEAAESAGLAWGGRWKMMDFGHLELRRAGVLARSR